MKKKFLYFWAEWDNMPYSKRSQFVNECRNLGVKFDTIDVESEEGVDLSIKYNIKNVPTIIVIDHKHREIGREKGNEGYKNIAKYL